MGNLFPAFGDPFGLEDLDCGEKIVYLQSDCEIAWKSEQFEIHSIAIRGTVYAYQTYRCHSVRQRIELIEKQK